MLESVSVNLKIYFMQNDTFNHFTENQHKKNPEHSNELINKICVYIFVVELLNFAVHLLSIFNHSIHMKLAKRFCQCWIVLSIFVNTSNSHYPFTHQAIACLPFLNAMANKIVYNSMNFVYAQKLWPSTVKWNFFFVLLFFFSKRQ